MADPATRQPEIPEELSVMVKDAEGLPLEAPLTYDQARLAVWLHSALARHRDREGLRWHLGLNDRIDYLDADGSRGFKFPDLFVVQGLPQRSSDPYKVWVRDLPPTVVVEFSVGSSLAGDRGEKRDVYERIGVAEYFVFDVAQVEVAGVLEGWRRDPATGRFAPIAPVERRPDEINRLPSRALGLDLAVVPDDLAPYGARLRAFRPDASDPLPTEEESAHAEALAAKDEQLRALRERLERLEGEAGGASERG